MINRCIVSALIFSCLAGYPGGATSTGLSFVEEFSDTKAMDEGLTTAKVCTSEQTLMQGFQKTPWQSTNRPWERGILDEQGYDTRSIAVGDLNGDRYPDIAVANYGEVNLIYFGKGDGTFGPGAPLSSDTHNTEGIELGDINGDAHPDLIEGNSNAYNYFYINNGDGTFQVPTAFSGDTCDTRAVALGDVNNDGWMDVVFANNGKAPLCYYNDTGVFKKAVDIGEEALPATGILIDDVNRDGWADLVLGSWDHPLRVFLNDGSGFFGDATLVTGNLMKTKTLAAGDLNNDGRQDIIAGNFAAADCVFSDGPEFQWAASIFSSNQDLTADIALGDLDGNGLIDVVKAEDSLAHRYYLNKGDGIFGQGTAFFDGTQSPACVALADLDGNGLLDIVAGQVHAPNCIYLNQGCMNPFIGSRRGALDVSSQGVTSMIAGDFNGDTLPDIVVGIMKERLHLYLSDGQGGFSEGIPLTQDKQATTSVASGDINKDGHLDFVAGTMKQGNRYYLNNGDGTFSGHSLGPDIFATTSVKMGDINGDGFPDVVVGHMNVENQVFLNDGRGAFHPAMDIADDRFDTFCIALGDVNGDGRLDVVTGNYGDKNRLYLNTGGAFPFFGVKAQCISEDESDTLSLELADMNGDGHLDVVAGNFNNRNRLYLNTGAEAPFDGAAGLDIGSDKDKTFSVSCADMDGDGDLDFVAGNAGSQDKLYLNNGTDTPFRAVIPVPLAEQAYETLCIHAADLDNDHAPDIVASRRDAPCFIYWNSGQPHRQYGLSCLPETVSAFLEVGGTEGSNTDVIVAAAGSYIGQIGAGRSVPHFSFNAGMAVSLPVNSPEQRITAVSVSLRTEYSPNTEVLFYLTNNGGETWVGARDGQTVFFPSPGNRLAWKAVFQTWIPIYAARIYEIGLTVPEFTIAFETDGTPGARCEGSTIQKICAGERALSVRALAPEGRCFARWMLDGKHYSFENPVIVCDVCGDLTLTAVYSKAINSMDDLQRIGIDPDFPLDGRYCLSNDLEVSVDTSFSPISSPDTPFSGWFFGNNHVISGLSLSGARDVFNGLFCIIGEGAEVRDLFLNNVDIRHSGSVTGALAGRNDGLIENCHVTGRLVYDYDSNLRGGLVGENGASGILSHSAVVADVGCRGESVGGLAGRNSGLITDSVFRGRVSGEKSVGGIAGCQEGGSLHNSCAIGGVTAIKGNVGGLVGLAKNAEITGCFASSETASPSGTAGGLIGSAWNTRVRECFSLSQIKADEGPVASLTGMHHAGSVEFCYAAGPVVGSIAAGLFNCPGAAVPKVINAYWDKESTGQNLACAPGIELGDAHAKTTAEMMNPDTYLSWKFSPGDAFGIVLGKTYPFLRWNPPEAAIACVKGGEAETACFDIYFSLPVPGFDREDLVITSEGVIPLEITLMPENGHFPSLWHAAVRVDGPLGRVNAAVALPDCVVSDMASYTVFSGAPSSLAVETVHPDSVTCTWKNNGNPGEGFLLYLSKGESTDETVVTIAPDTVRYTVEALQPGTKYILDLSAISGAYESHRTDAVSVWTQAYPPLKPTVVVPAENAIEISITSGDQNPARTEYALRISPEAGDNYWVQPGGGRGVAPSWNNAEGWATTRVSGLKSATRYAVVALARNGAGELTEESPGEIIFTHCELNYMASVNGAVRGGRQTVAYGQDGLLVTADPYSGYRFLQWSDGSRDNPRQDKGVRENIHVEAQFVPLFAGTGTADAPYEITDLETLQSISGYLDKHFVLKNDVDASSTSAWNDGAGFTPIGTVTAPFTGTFSGNNFVILGLAIDRRKDKNAGLFGVMGSGAQIKQVVLKKVRLNARENAGALVGYNNGGRISECFVTGAVSGGVNIGGLLGYGEAGVLDLCRAECSVKGIENIGGLAGFCSNIAFSRCYASCTVEGSHNTGGFGGYMVKSILTNCYSRSTVTGVGYAGGLLGYNHTGTVQYCYATGNVSCPANAGGLLGFNDNGTLMAAYWDATVTTQAASHGSDPSFGKTTEEMYFSGTFKNWDFESVWVIRENEDYPRLQALLGNGGN